MQLNTTIHVTLILISWGNILPDIILSHPMITFRKHALISYDEKDKQWSVMAIRDCYYCPNAKFCDTTHLNFMDLEWINLSKDSKIAVKEGYVISLLQDHSHVYKVSIDNASTIRLEQNVHNLGEPLKISNENIDLPTEEYSKGMK